MSHPEYDKALAEVERHANERPWDVRELSVHLYHIGDIGETHTINAVRSLAERGRIGWDGWYVHRLDALLGAKISPRNDERSAEVPTHG